MVLMEGATNKIRDAVLNFGLGEKKMGFCLLVCLYLLCSFRNSNWDNSSSIQKVNIRQCKT